MSGEFNGKSCHEKGEKPGIIVNDFDKKLLSVRD